MAGLLFGGTLRSELGRPDHPNNDRLVFSKGHASPLFYALWDATWEEVRKDDIALRVIDLYNVKPLDRSTQKEAARATRVVLTVEDHCAEGGIGEAVSAALAADAVPVYSLAVRSPPGAGRPGSCWTTRRSLGPPLRPG